MEQVKKLIALRQQTEAPFMSSGKSQVNTDMDVFPYPRFYRGNYQSNEATIFEREAGYKPRHDSCYHYPSNMQVEEFYPNHCFQAAPSTTYPCYPEYLRKSSDKDELTKQLYLSKVLEYR